MTKGSLLYEGKGKKVFQVANDSGKLWLEFKDQLTAFNAQKLGRFDNKGAVNRDITSLIFRFLKKHDVQSHWVQDIGANEMITAKLTMIPLEVVVRNRLAGSTAKKFAIEEGTALKQPLVEFYYKKDEQAVAFSHARFSRRLEQETWRLSQICQSLRATLGVQYQALDH